MQKIKKRNDIYKESWFTTVSKDFKRNRTIYLLLIPVLLYYIMFHYAPMYGSVIAFQNFKPQKGILGSDFVGLMHFKNFFNSPFFGRILFNTLRISFASIIFGFPAPIILALLLNELKVPRFAKVVQNITYMPHFISLVVICSLIREFTLDTGVINYILGFFGFTPTSLLNFPQYFTTVYVASGIWQEIGWGSIIYLAALSGINDELYNAAAIDGAGRGHMLLHVTLPGIAPTIVIMFILKIGSMMSLGSEKIILMYNDLIMDKADVISSYVYRLAFGNSPDYGFSTAVNLFNMVINVILLVSANYISGRLSETSLW